MLRKKSGKGCERERGAKGKKEWKLIKREGKKERNQGRKPYGKRGGVVT